MRPCPLSRYPQARQDCSGQAQMTFADREGAIGRSTLKSRWTPCVERGKSPACRLWLLFSSHGCSLRCHLTSTCSLREPTAGVGRSDPRDPPSRPVTLYRHRHPSVSPAFQRGRTAFGLSHLVQGAPCGVQQARRGRLTGSNVPARSCVHEDEERHAKDELERRAPAPRLESKPPVTSACRRG
jgi:hypothetical protein